MSEIEKKAEKFSDSNDIGGLLFRQGLYKGYISGYIESQNTENTNLKLAVTKTLELLEGNPTWTIDELHKYLKSLNE